MECRNPPPAAVFWSNIPNFSDTRPKEPSQRKSCVRSKIRHMNYCIRHVFLNTTFSRCAFRKHAFPRFQPVDSRSSETTGTSMCLPPVVDRPAYKLAHFGRRCFKMDGKTVVRQCFRACRPDRSDLCSVSQSLTNASENI